jgi:hypothetical protein
VQDIALWHERLGLSAGEIVSRFPQLSLAAVDAALTYYRDHLSEIQLPIDSADALAKEVTARHHSRLPEFCRGPNDAPAGELFRRE